MTYCTFLDISLWLAFFRLMSKPQTYVVFCDLYTDIFHFGCYMKIPGICPHVRGQTVKLNAKDFFVWWNFELIMLLLKKLFFLLIKVQLVNNCPHGSHVNKHFDRYIYIINKLTYSPNLMISFALRILYNTREAIIFLNSF